MAKEEKKLEVAISASQQVMPLKDALKSADKAAISKALRVHKRPNGAPNYLSLLAIPTSERLPELAKKDYTGTLTLLVGGITLAVESMNLSRPMSGEQIADLAEEIIDSANEDNLALEDLIMFMQRLTRGQYGALYESMDIPKFMEKFEIYRNERHQELIRYRESKHLEHKALGDAERSCSRDDIAENLGNVMGRMNEMKEQIKELPKR